MLLTLHGEGGHRSGQETCHTKTGMTVGKPVCGHQGHKGQPNLQSSLCISASPELCPAACTTCSAKQGNNPAVKHPDNMGLMSIHLLQGLCQQC